METRLPSSVGTVLTLIALALGIALGQPLAKQPRDPGLVAAEAVTVIIECPPPPVAAPGVVCARPGPGEGGAA